MVVINQYAIAIYTVYCGIDANALGLSTNNKLASAI